ncbi:hypothetical protein [Falsiroseomonas sp. CW058]|uniref:hypothetical protein n=1 Tax=Falsiroseomonas sp. CW058 TaxID=3388664 RepID=UPI003D32257A
MPPRPTPSAPVALDPDALDAVTGGGMNAPWSPPGSSFDDLFVLDVGTATNTAPQGLDSGLHDGGGTAEPQLRATLPGQGGG